MPLKYKQVTRGMDAKLKHSIQNSVIHLWFLVKQWKINSVILLDRMQNDDNNNNKQ